MDRESCDRRTIRPSTQPLTVVALIAMAALASPNGAKADEGGVSFWIPGTFGSLAAVPIQQRLTRDGSQGGCQPSAALRRAATCPGRSAAQRR
jgi:hypothetical protein